MKTKKHPTMHQRKRYNWTPEHPGWQWYTRQCQCLGCWQWSPDWQHSCILYTSPSPHIQGGHLGHWYPGHSPFIMPLTTVQVIRETRVLLVTCQCNDIKDIWLIYAEMILKRRLYIMMQMNVPTLILCQSDWMEKFLPGLKSSEWSDPK